MSSFETGLPNSISPEEQLANLFESDQKDRNDGLPKSDPDFFVRREEERYHEAQKIFSLYEKNPELFSGKMKFDLALLFQHGKISEDYRRALELARSSEADGFGGAETLVKVAEDRYLLSIGEPQKWGTQTQIKK